MFNLANRTERESQPTLFLYLCCLQLAAPLQAQHQRSGSGLGVITALQLGLGIQLSGSNRELQSQGQTVLVILCGSQTKETELNIREQFARDGRADWSDRDIAGEIVRCEIYGQNCKNADCDEFFFFFLKTLQPLRFFTYSSSTLDLQNLLKPISPFFHSLRSQLPADMS